METVLSHEIAAVPPSLFHDDGGMRKCTKSDRAKKIEASFKTFSELGEKVLQRVMALLTGGLQVTCVALKLVFDRYDHPLNSLRDREEVQQEPLV